MKRLTYNKVFSKYNLSLNDRLAQVSHKYYKKARLLCTRWFPLKEHEKFLLDDNDSFGRDSSEMPKGYDSKQGKSTKGFVNLKYLTLLDYLPKENLELFKRELNGYIYKNKKEPQGSLLTEKDYDSIDNWGTYYDGTGYSNLATVKLSANNEVQKLASAVSISLRNLSQTFLVVKYQFFISDSFNTNLNTILNKQFDHITDVFRQYVVPWYKPHLFGRSIYDGDDLRRQEVYRSISMLKWSLLIELRNNFTINFYNDGLFPPAFQTYKTNIPPSKSRKIPQFWNGLFLGFDSDYSLYYNACVSWSYENSKNEGICLSAFFGNGIENSFAFDYYIADIYAVYLVALSMNMITKRDIAISNQIASKVIRRASTSAILKERVRMEQRIYYEYRFINEFTGDSIEKEDFESFKCLFHKNGSISSRRIANIRDIISDTKTNVDNILRIYDSAAEYANAKSSMRIQWVMLFITVFSLVIAIMSLQKTNSSFLVSIWEMIKGLYDQTVIWLNHKG